MNIYQKLVEVRKAVPFLKKDTSGYQFKYVSSSQALGALRAAMDKQGLLLVPSVVNTSLTHLESAKGRKTILTELAIQFTWINAENPEERLECKFYGQGIDDGEKGVGKAATYAEKYFLLKFFNIPTDKDDPDRFQSKPSEEKMAKPKKPEKESGPLASPAQRKQIQNMLKDPDISEHLATRAAAAESDPNLTSEKADKIIEHLSKALEGVKK